MGNAITVNDRNRRLFWFLKDGAHMDLEKPEQCDLYVQQVLSHGKTEDVKELLHTLPAGIFRSSFQRVERFLPKEVRGFWEKYLGNQ